VTTTVTIQLDAATAAVVALRTAVREPGGRRPGRSTAIRTALARYYALLDRAERSLRARLTDDEWTVCMAALANSAWTPETVALCWHTIDDAVALDGLDRQYGVDGEGLRAKLSGMTALDCAALVDAAERQWGGG
jgi:hypothetical protein